MAIRIGDRDIGQGGAFIVAEAGVNHNGDLAIAHQLVDAAVDAGADAIKFQTFKAEKVMSARAPKAAYQKEATDNAESQLDMVKPFEFPPEVFEELYRYCQRQGITFLSTPFDADSADFLVELGVTAVKIPSGEVTNIPFIEHVAGKGRPIILSTGMANLGEVDAAVRAIRGMGNEDCVLMHCVSNYPSEPADTNLRAMATMKEAFAWPVGYSDHTLGIEIALAAVALGACVIEKHITLDCGLPGPDHRASLEPDGLQALVAGIRKVERSLGHGRKEPVASEAATADVARRSLVAAADLRAGAVLDEGMIEILRPGTGLPPMMRLHLVGRTLKKDVEAGALFSLSDLE
jgi:N,N'-diacetyllegionaminate synthase